MKNFKSSIKLYFCSSIPFLLLSSTAPKLNALSQDSTTYATISIEGNNLSSSSHAQLFMRDFEYFADSRREHNENRNKVIDEKAANSGNGMYSIHFSKIYPVGLRYAEIDCYISENIAFTLPFFIEPGDSIKIIYNNGMFNFSGNKSEKYKCQHRLNQILFSSTSQRSLSKTNYIHYLDSISLLSLNVLDEYKNEISDSVFMVIKSFIIDRCQRKKNIEIISLNHYDSISKFNYKNPIWNESVSEYFKTTLIARQSIMYADFLTSQYEFDSCYSRKTRINFKNCYQYITRKLSGPAREWAILNLVQKHNLDSEDGENIEKCVKDAIKSGFVDSDSVKNILVDYCDLLIPGKKAFNFSSENIHGERVRLTDFKGKVVLLDFYCHPCGACRRNHSIIDSISKQYLHKDFVVIGIFSPSGTQNKKLWRRLVMDEVYTSQIDINLIDKAYADTFHNVASKYKVNGFPTLILINKNGRLIGSPIIPYVDNGAHLNELIHNNL
ncbi:peroxiredoxin family protein [Chitinophaga filiformis]|uniref:TlpA family protein disulfide reductase n=1 Tax=Chitinophaga filiformis TaxID=104663 RepID=A0ABY4HYG2_CHIFI|nr:TlpA disulfide reductase family protein [Chitinophaga filiformis]UPK68054.1 TlpA family protein disulfide reductase [Chitinophaga filiformis]